MQEVLHAKNAKAKMTMLWGDSEKITTIPKHYESALPQDEAKLSLYSMIVIQQQV